MWKQWIKANRSIGICNVESVSTFPAFNRKQKKNLMKLFREYGREYSIRSHYCEIDNGILINNHRNLNVHKRQLTEATYCACE